MSNPAVIEAEVLSAPVELPPGVTPEMMAMASRAITAAIEQPQHSTAKVIIHVGYLAKLAYDGERIPRETFKTFTRALGVDGRLSYRGEGKYWVEGSEQSFTAAKKAMVSPVIDESKIEASVRTFLEQSPPEVPSDGRWILKFAKRAGVELSPAEVTAFYVAISSDPRIRPEEDGSFTVRGAATEPADYGQSIPDGIFSKEDVRRARRVLGGGRRLNRLFYPANKRTYNALTRGDRAVHPAKLQEVVRRRFDRSMSRYKRVV